MSIGKERRVRVLHVIQNLNYGGMERLLADIVRLVDPEVVESHVLCLGYLGRFAEGLEGMAKLHVGAKLPRWSMLWPGPMIRQIQEIAPDVLHTHSGVWYKTSLAGRYAGVRHLVHTEHGRPMPDPWNSRIWDALAARRTDTVVAVSGALQGYLERTGIARPDQIEVIPNGVDTDEYQPRRDDGKLRRELGIPMGVPIIGAIGRMEPVKGPDVMVDAFIHLMREWRGAPGPDLVIAGEGSMRAALQEKLREAGVAGEAHLLGWRDDIHDLQQAFTVFTLGSRSEGTSVSLLQAMSAGICPVVTDVGGNAAVLGPELSHRLVPSESPRELAAGWERAITDEIRRAHDVRIGRQRVLREFGLRSMVDRYQELYLAGAGAGALAPGRQEARDPVSR